EQMLGLSLKKYKLVIGHDSKGKPQIHEFDLVSDDASIVGEVKSGEKSRSNYERTLNDCLFLAKIKAKRKLLILTNKEFYDYFRAKSDGLISRDIEVMFIRPEDLVLMSPPC
ncbi:MAG TPA: hypothetical protein VMS94_04730, partial [Acidobacteriota bacterium]|nr:hypothetical protein [Acidobacteriota bacterium]